MTVNVKIIRPSASCVCSGGCRQTKGPKHRKYGSLLILLKNIDESLT